MVAMDDNELAFATEGSVSSWMVDLELEQRRLGSALMLGTISIYILHACPCVKFCRHVHVNINKIS